MMASKYPSPYERMESSYDNSDVEEPLTISSIFTTNKILLIASLLALLFLVLAHPLTFKTVGSLIPGIHGGSSVDTKLLAVHTVVFAVGAFVLLRMF
jgi:hypothetical protein